MESLFWVTHCSPHAEHNSFDDKPWILKLVDFTKKVLAQDRVRLIGICFGHQIIGRALGVKVDRSTTGWEVSVLPFTLTEKGKELFKKDTIVSSPPCGGVAGKGDDCRTGEGYARVAGLARCKMYARPSLRVAAAHVCGVETGPPLQPLAEKPRYS